MTHWTLYLLLALLSEGIHVFKLQCHYRLSLQPSLPENPMANKLDPIIAQYVNEYVAGQRSGSQKVMILIAVSRIPESTDFARLSSAGLKVNSSVGDILTGSIELSRVKVLSMDPLVVSIEYSRWLEGE